MKTININDNVVSGHAIYKLRDYCSITYNDMSSNCKYCYIDNCGNLVTSLKHNKDYTLKRLKQIFTINKKIIFGINTPCLETLKYLQKTFKLVSVSKIPLGYYGDYQYHAIFFTNITTNIRDINSYKKRVEKFIKKEKTKLTKKDKLKILSYKNKKWLSKYLDKLIS